MTRPDSRQSASPDLRGKRVTPAAADHPNVDQWGVVVDQVPCALCKGECELDDLVVLLDDGTTTRIYEPEAEVEGDTWTPLTPEQFKAVFGDLPTDGEG